MEKIKEFLTIWGNGYKSFKGNTIKEFHDIDFFTKDNGYNNEEIKSIKSLKVGGCISLNDFSGVHSVIRLK